MKKVPSTKTKKKKLKLIKQIDERFLSFCKLMMFLLFPTYTNTHEKYMKNHNNHSGNRKKIHEKKKNINQYSISLSTIFIKHKKLYVLTKIEDEESF